MTPEEQKAADAKAKADAEEKAKAEEKRQSKIPTPEWQKADYTGPLDAVQAKWRTKNIKPAGNKKTK